MKNEACLRHKKNYGRGSALFRSESFYPQNWLFCVGKIVDYKRRSVGRFRGRFFRRRDGAPNKTLRFCSSARRSGRLRRPGSALLPVTADLPVIAKLKACFLCGLKVGFISQPARNSALRITNYEFLLMIAPLSAEDTISAYLLR